MKLDEQLVTQSEEMRIDIMQVYQSSCFGPKLPLFENLYQEYHFQVIKAEMDMSIQELRSYQQMLQNGQYDASMIDVGAVQMKDELMLFDYLLRSGFAFEHQKSVFNPPMTKVW